jgi:hypothetical protein
LAQAAQAEQLLQAELHQMAVTLLLVQSQHQLAVAVVQTALEQREVLEVAEEEAQMVLAPVLGLLDRVIPLVILQAVRLLVAAAVVVVLVLLVIMGQPLAVAVAVLVGIGNL